MRNKGRFINWQKTSEVKSKKKYSGEQSPYWQFLNKRTHEDGDRGDNGSLELREYPTANPDVLPEPDQEEENKTRQLMFDVIKSVRFSKKERAVLNLVALRGKTEEEAAAMLGISRSSIQVYIRRAQKKCQKAFVIKSRDSGVYDE